MIFYLLIVFDGHVHSLVNAVYWYGRLFPRMLSCEYVGLCSLPVLFQGSFLLLCPGKIQKYMASGWCWGWLHLFMVSGPENPVKLNPLKRKLMMLSETEYNVTGCISAH